MATVLGDGAHEGLQPAGRGGVRGGGSEEQPEGGDARLGRHLLGAAREPVPVDAVVAQQRRDAEDEPGEHGDHGGGEQGDRATGDDETSTTTSAARGRRGG